MTENLNLGDAMDYGQRSHRGSLGDVVLETLGVLEAEGRPDAFLHIKWVLGAFFLSLTCPWGGLRKGNAFFLGCLALRALSWEVW